MHIDSYILRNNTLMSINYFLQPSFHISIIEMCSYELGIVASIASCNNGQSLYMHAWPQFNPYIDLTRGIELHKREEGLS